SHHRGPMAPTLVARIGGDPLDIAGAHRHVAELQGAGDNRGMRNQPASFTDDEMRTTEGVLPVSGAEALTEGRVEQTADPVPGVGVQVLRCDDLYAHGR